VESGPVVSVDRPAKKPLHLRKGWEGERAPVMEGRMVRRKKKKKMASLKSLRVSNPLRSFRGAFSVLAEKEVFRKRGNFKGGRFNSSEFGERRRFLARGPDPERKDKQEKNRIE